MKIINKLLYSLIENIPSQKIPPNIKLYFRWHNKHFPKDGKADYEQIKIPGQSCYLASFSTPNFARYNDKLEYKKSHAVTSLFVKEIRNVVPNILDIKHAKTRFQFAHCEIITNISDLDKNKNRGLRRAIRHQIGLKLITEINPEENLTLRIKYKGIKRLLIDLFQLILFQLRQ